MHDPTSPRPSRLRSLALAGAVALVLAIPLALVASGPPGPGDDGGAATARAHPAPVPHSPVPALPGAAGPEAQGAARCGPRVASPGGVSAQSCVLTRGADTWARAQIGTAAGGPLRARLTLHRPDGRTVHAHCDVAAGAASGICETPREPTLEESPGRPYAAAVEVAHPDGGEPPLRAASDHG